MHSPVEAVALIALAGIGAQWIAWRLSIPAIIAMLVAGFLLGPIFGVLDPRDLLGGLFNPLISVAVALILFEGALSLNLRDLRADHVPLFRLIGLGVPLAWAIGSLAAWTVAGLSWQVSAFIGALLIVTGPTVIVPMLREAKIKRQPATILKWEGILNDPLGVLLAVFIFQFTIQMQDPMLSWVDVSVHMVVSAAVAAASGLAFGWLVAQSLRRGWVPEFLKIPFTVTSALSCYAAGAYLEHEAGLLAVTVMGITVANFTLPALDELKRFKESISVLLVSGVFIVLTASLTWDQVAGLDWRLLAFGLTVLFIVRPVTILLVTLGGELTWQERLFLAWIAPRGVVVFTIAGVFAGKLAEAGIEDAGKLVPLAFSFVVLTVMVHGATVGWLARRLDLEASTRSGVLIVGSSCFSTALGRVLSDNKVPVYVIDTNWRRLRLARDQGLPCFYGEVLSDFTEHELDLGRFDHVIAASDSQAYNSLVNTELAPRVGREHIYQIAVRENLEANESRTDLPVNLLGQALLPDGPDFDELEQRIATGWRFRSVSVGEDQVLESIDIKDAEPVVAIEEDGTLKFQVSAKQGDQKEGDQLIFFHPPDD